MIRAVIIDDEIGVHNVLSDLLTLLCPDVQITGTAINVQSGLVLIRKTMPDLVFLDVEMPDGTGFELLNKLDEIPFKIIFVTAYGQFAIKAIRFAALDYILKPINSDELASAIERFRSNTDQSSAIKSLMNHLNVSKTTQKISISSVGRVQYVDIEDIVRFESDGSYTIVYSSDGSKIVSTKPIKEYEDTLSHRNFFRTHRSHLINITKVKEYSKQDGELVVMSDGSKVDISRLKRMEFLDAMENLKY